MPTRANPLLLITALCFGGLVTAAGDTDDLMHRQHGQHEHGAAVLQLISEGQDLFITLQTPAANVVGFEHAARNPEQHHMIAQGMDGLRDAGHLFRFPPAADCRLHEADIDSPLDESHDHAPATAHDRGENAGPGHADIAVNYHFRCGEPQALDRLDLNLFDRFPAMQRIRVEFVVGSTQGAAIATADNRSIAF